MNAKGLVVAGVDVGGTRKGFHAVAFEDGAYRDQFASGDSGEIGGWCRQMGAQFVGIDAPCRWSMTGRARPAEMALMKEKIFCFSSPTRAIAEAHPKDHFRWMLNGGKLFEVLRPTHMLFDGSVRSMSDAICFETFPHAIACALAGKVVSGNKRTVRRELLSNAGIEISKLTNIDLVDAALCALTADHLARGSFKTYGEMATGFIVVPGRLDGI